MAKKKMELTTKLMIAGVLSLWGAIILGSLSIHMLGGALREAGPELKKSAGDGITFISSSWNAGKKSNPR